MFMRLDKPKTAFFDRQGNASPLFRMGQDESGGLCYSAGRQQEAIAQISPCAKKKLTSGSTVQSCREHTDAGCLLLSKPCSSSALLIICS